MGLSLRGLGMRLLSNEVNPHDMHEGHTRFLRMSCQQKHCPGDGATGPKDHPKTLKPSGICSAVFRIYLRRMPLFLLSISSCWDWNTSNRYPMPAPPLYFASRQFVPSVHRSPEWLLPRSSPTPDTDDGFGSFELMRFWTPS